ncbi:MAG: DUF2088 domain-containing protein, partial [Deltaproteobacteria bacterium]|nr:DUF2088 domain-containing protein [Deltaproteobacteria bacterium]
MRAALLCDQKTVDVKIPDAVRLLQMRRLDPLPDPVRSVREAVDQPIGSAPLREIARGRKNACVVISDITRPVPNKIILPPLLEALEASGMPADRITILISNGMHRPNEGEELEYMVGREIMERYTIVNHYCRDPR